MRIRKRNRFIKQIVLGFALVALLVPAGRVKAMPDAGRSYEPAKVGGTAIGVPHAGLNDYLRNRDGIEIARLQPRSTLRNSDMVEQVRVSGREVSTPQAVASPGFDWSDAGIGAGIFAGLVLLGGAAFLGTRHLGKPQTA